MIRTLHIQNAVIFTNAKITQHVGKIEKKMLSDLATFFSTNSL